MRQCHLIGPKQVLETIWGLFRPILLAWGLAINEIVIEERKDPGPIDRLQTHR